MDILGALPVELSIRVMKYLTPADSILLRLVSRSYHELLTSEEVCSSLSRHFIKREYNASKKLDSWRLHYENHVSRRLSYGFGKPWMTELLPRMRSGSFCPETSYFAGVPSAACHSVQVLDLNAYPAEYVFPPTRTPDNSEIMKVVLLPSFVVVLTRAKCGYSWNLETHQLYRFEVPDSSDSYPANIYGNENLIIVTLPDLVIVHDVQAEKSSSFKVVGDDTRIWDGVEVVCQNVVLAIANAEKRVVWLIREIHDKGFFDPRAPSVIDSLLLGTGEVVPGEFRSSAHCGIFYYGCDGLWQFWDAELFDCHLGPAGNTASVQAERVVFDIETGAWTEEAYTIIFSGCVTEFDSFNFYSGPMTRSDGLGCFIEGTPSLRVWMLDQEPGDRVTRARPLDLDSLADLPATEGRRIYSFLGLCDRFILGDTGAGAVVVRFKGIHE